MSRINTNISSLQAIDQLNKNNNALQTSLQRLSTGLQINSGKDAPAGLIAIDGLVESVIADYWLDANGRVRDANFMTTYMRALIGEDDE